MLVRSEEMNRREFSLSTAGILAAAALPASPALAQASRPIKGKDYMLLEKPAAVEAPQGKVEVVEFFWYSCPHCNAFEPTLASWIKRQPADVYVRRAPVAFDDNFIPEQRLFYTLEALNKVDELHYKVFNAIHIDRLRLNTESNIADWMAKQGVDKAKFTEHFNSFTVATKARRAYQLQQAYKVEGVPALGIAGRYYTDGTLAGTTERSLQVTDFLVAEARKMR
jgi:protein dithiol oxidoreductase (disulfide-forming)